MLWSARTILLLIGRIGHLSLLLRKPEFKNTINQNEGLWQRLNLVFMYLPLIIVAIKHLTVRAK